MGLKEITILTVLIRLRRCFWQAFVAFMGAKRDPSIDSRIRWSRKNNDSVQNAGTQAIIYVIDSTDIHRLSATAKELQAIMQEKELMDTDLLVFANKQDAPNALNASEISEKLGLTEMRNKNWTVISTSAITGEGLAEGLDWLVNSIKSQTNTM
ncbi:unnamed protein product [Pneumocystis jirovecii]|uniref:ADP-ribosylation factor n=1 Tax=Pneumocystis jirovecii TaxID=42068 RepID=L0PAI8_PNEJI|nr:unnamed protein product [Pneumocystis jirovecii]CCJ31055.1 unnamed protein product [Pneumocystis jirovecii]